VERDINIKREKSGSERRRSRHVDGRLWFGHFVAWLVLSQRSEVELQPGRTDDLVAKDGCLTPATREESGGADRLVLQQSTANL
jgi:hypothetical protein